MNRVVKKIRRSPGNKMGLYFALAAAGALVYILLLLPLAEEIGQCPIKVKTGISCPTCGMTRSASMLAGGDILSSFRYNPLFISVIFGLLFWGVVSVISLLTGRPLRFAISPKGHTVIRLTLPILFIANWLYLIMAL